MKQDKLKYIIVILIILIIFTIYKMNKDNENKIETNDYINNLDNEIYSEEANKL